MTVAASNFQGLFETIGGGGKVTNLHVDTYIKVGNARMVGGIAGNNYGTIENCFVNGHVESDHYHSSKDADLGGIVGLNESGGTVKYCFMSGDVKNTDGNSGVGGIAGSNEGTIEHVTFFGSVSVDHSQDNKWAGDQDNTLNNNYDSFNQSEYNSASGNDMYRRGLKYGSLSNPFVISSDAALARQITAFNINFGEGDETTGIITMYDARSEMSDVWYSLDGRKLNGKPTEKGVYVNTWT